jgi:hypothetical protein
MLSIRSKRWIVIQIFNGSEKGVRCDSKIVRFDFEIVLYNTEIVPFNFKIARYDVEIVHYDPENTVINPHSKSWVFRLIMEMYCPTTGKRNQIYVSESDPRLLRGDFRVNLNRMLTEFVLS